MAQNLQMDPAKRDYVLVNGSPVPSDRVYEASYIALLIPQNNWLYGVEGQGSLLYTLANVKRSRSIEQQFASYANDAITRQLINNGQAAAVNVTNIQATRTGTSNEIDVTPAAKQVSQDLGFNSVG